MILYYLVEHSFIYFLDTQTLHMLYKWVSTVTLQKFHLTRAELTFSFPLPLPFSKKTYIHFNCSKTSILDELESLSTWISCWTGLFAQARYLFEVQRSNNTYIWDVLWAKTSPGFFPSWYTKQWVCSNTHVYLYQAHLCM